MPSVMLEAGSNSPITSSEGFVGSAARAFRNATYCVPSSSGVSFDASLPPSVIVTRSGAARRIAVRKPSWSSVKVAIVAPEWAES